MPNKPSPQQPAAENQDLRARLEKAEATLHEILSGEADALFVTGVAGAQLFTLKGADQSYRTLIENMSEGALTLTAEGVILYANQRFAEMLGTPLEKVIGSGIHTWLAPESRQVLQTLLRKDAVDNQREELALTAADGTQVPVYLSVNRLLLDGMPDSFCMVATDLTAQKRNEAILADERLARAILEQAP
ncbi:MAG: PAS domain S-box protein, partial [Thiobacillus sp.]